LDFFVLLKDKSSMAEVKVRDVEIEVEGVKLPGRLGVPERCKMLVMFAHGSGSSRLSPRNNYVADILRKSRLGTLLFDLLTEEEDADYERRFDIPLISKRFEQASKWVMKNKELKDLRLGYFGASTGSAAAMVAASKFGKRISAIVSRGGRPDLVLEVLDRVVSPTMLIVGGYDLDVLALNRRAYERLGCEKRLEVIEGATHLFEEPGALDKVAELATEWFLSHAK